MLQRFPETVKWHNDRMQRLASLAKALAFQTLAMTFATMIAVTFWRQLADTQTPFGLIFSLVVSLILASKIIPGLFDLWRMFLWAGRALFRPRGTQYLQIAVASLVTFGWIAMMVVTALRLAGPVMQFFGRWGIHVSV